MSSGDALKTVCTRLGVSLVHAKPYAPEARRKTERFWRTLREGCLDHLGFTVADGLDPACRADRARKAGRLTNQQAALLNLLLELHLRCGYGATLNSGRPKTGEIPMGVAEGSQGWP